MCKLYASYGKQITLPRMQRGLTKALYHLILLLISIKAVMTVVTLCDGNVTNRHDVTVILSNMTVPLKTVTDVTVCDGLRPQTKTGQVKQGRQSVLSI